MTSDCTRCHGDGEIEEDDDYGLGASVFVRCWLCDGTGELDYETEEEEDEECPELNSHCCCCRCC